MKKRRIKMGRKRSKRCPNPLFVTTPESREKMAADLLRVAEDQSIMHAFGFFGVALLSAMPEARRKVLDALNGVSQKPDEPRGAESADLQPSSTAAEREPQTEV